MRHKVIPLLAEYFYEDWTKVAAVLGDAKGEGHFLERMLLKAPSGFDADDGIEPRYRVGSLESGALLCRAYEAYVDMHKPAGISFEHAWFLLLALARHDEVGVARCAW